jgi:hypothetical protein
VLAVGTRRLAVGCAILAGFPVRALPGPALPVLRRGGLAAIRRREPGRLKAGRCIGLRLAGFRPLAGLVRHGSPYGFWFQPTPGPGADLLAPVGQHVHGKDDERRKQGELTGTGGTGAAGF